MRTPDHCQTVSQEIRVMGFIFNRRRADACWDTASGGVFEIPASSPSKSRCSTVIA
jgi:hypothetical protein